MLPCGGAMRLFDVKPTPMRSLGKTCNERFDVYWLVHNFVRAHFTTKVVPAVKLGILEVGLSWFQLLTMRYAV